MQDLFKAYCQKNIRNFNNSMYDPAVPLLGIYPGKTVIQKVTCTSTFPAAVFPVAETQSRPKCPLTDESIKKMWYIHTMEYYSAIKRNETMPFAT